MASPERKRRRRKKGVLPPPPEPPSLDVYYETVRGRERLRAMLTAGLVLAHCPISTENVSDNLYR